MKIPRKPDVFNALQSANYIGISLNTFKRKVLPEIDYAKFSERVYHIPKSELDRWIEEHRVKNR